MFDFCGAIRRVSTELVGDGEAQQAKRQLVFGFDRQDVAANRFGLLRFVERAVELGFRDGFGNPGLRDGLQLKFHETSLYFSPIQSMFVASTCYASRILRTSMSTGS